MRNPAISSEGTAKTRQAPSFGRRTSRLVRPSHAPGALRCRRKFDLRDLHPRDMIDIQSFLWVQGSDEYE
jgi:hypothetical protein